MKFSLFASLLILTTSLYPSGTSNPYPGYTPIPQAPAQEPVQTPQVGPSSEQKDFALQFNSEDLKKSKNVKVAGMEVPMMVVTEIQKVCQQKGLSIEECNKLVEKGCVELRKVYHDRNVHVTDVPVLVNVNLHIHEHKHTVHQTQKRYTYHYDVKVTRSQSESHEYKELPAVHDKPTYNYNDQKNCPLHGNTYQRKRQPNNPTTFYLPSCLRLTQDIARFVSYQRLNCQVRVVGSWLAFTGPDAYALGRIIFRHFPGQHAFDRATYYQVQRLFQELEAVY